MDYNLLFRWFVGLSTDAAVWDVTVFTKNRDRVLRGDVAVQLPAAVVAQAQGRDLLADDHFSVDGTMIEAWASMKSFRPEVGDDDNGSGGGCNGERNVRGEKRSNVTHASTNDPHARLFRKGNGQSSQTAYLGHVLMENRNGLVFDAALTHATGTAEREAALDLLEDGRRGNRRVTLGADKGYDVADFIRDLRTRKVTPHIARNDNVTKTESGERAALTAAPPAIPATPSAFWCASGSRRSSAG